MAVSTKLTKVQLLVLFETLPTPNGYIHNGFVFMADCEHHGWYSAMPAFEKYVIMRKQQLKTEYNVDLKVVALFEDRGTIYCKSCKNL